MELKNARKKIDLLDTRIIGLLEKRFDLVVTIAKIKEKQSLPLKDTKRETKIFEKVYGCVYPKPVENIFKTVLKESKKIQRKSLTT